jgi:hypothetical protein
MLARFHTPMSIYVPLHVIGMYAHHLTEQVTALVLKNFTSLTSSNYTHALDGGLPHISLVRRARHINATDRIPFTTTFTPAGNLS